MKRSSLWKRITRRVAASSLALSLGVSAFAGVDTRLAAQLPQNLPPYSPASLPAPAPALPALPASLIQDKEAPKDAPPKESPKETPAAPAPMPVPAVVETPASCTTAASNRHGGLFGHLFGSGCAAGGCSTGRCGTGGCSSGGCSSGGCSSGGCGAGGCGSCVNGTCGPQACYSCGYNGCFPGHQNCCPVDECGGPLQRFWACSYHCLCCPDPCYEPRFIVEANSAFWVDGARPVTQTRIRWDSGHNFTQPDRSEWFMARMAPGGRGIPVVDKINYNTLFLYQEVATKKASFFIEQAYTGVSSPENDMAGGSGFGDMNIGTKALLFDCELMQVTFQFRTYIPIGSTGKGLGTGHVSLEPSILTTIKLCPETYFQGQLSEWAPIAGDRDWAGSVLHYHMSLNHVLYRCQPDVPLIGVIETNGYSFQDGLYTPPGGLPARQSSGGTWWTAGPGLRIAICNKVDFGFSAVFGLAPGGPDQTYRTEFRYRF